MKLVVTADHSTPCKLKNHSADPVPVLFYDGGEKDGFEFDEQNSKQGSLGKIYGQELLKKLEFV
jgi:2,3-bisphosphoglycerate-independent phosphoglycerate mutase